MELTCLPPKLKTSVVLTHTSKSSSYDTLTTEPWNEPSETKPCGICLSSQPLEYGGRRFRSSRSFSARQQFQNQAGRGEIVSYCKITHCPAANWPVCYSVGDSEKPWCPWAGSKGYAFRVNNLFATSSPLQIAWPCRDDARKREDRLSIDLLMLSVPRGQRPALNTRGKMVSQMAAKHLCLLQPSPAFLPSAFWLIAGISLWTHFISPGSELMKDTVKIVFQCLEPI